MAVFSLSSDNYFIMASYTKDDPDCYVFQYFYDPNDFEITRREGRSNDWSTVVRVGPSKQAEFGALEVFGVTIKGNHWNDLAKDLKVEGVDGQVFRLYGVRVPEFTSADVCNKCDLFTGATLVDVRGIMLAAEEAKEVENGRMEVAMCKKELECTKELVRKSGEAESLLNKLVEEKEKEVERVKVESAVREKELELTKEAVKKGKETELLLNNLLAAERQQVAALKATLAAFIDGYE
ncbi:unnamed protein product [Linum tenue]|uniref:Uncharacterized protein n=1 Tax=Linum tenue TaxID=586396 RepID=A0AAV0JFW5_9ROSI|nr:unnamed protein product [Linum tenue]